MRLLLLTLLICLTVLANAQQLTTYRTYYDELTRTRLHEEWTAKSSPNQARGVKHGLYKEFDAEGNLIREMQFADGKKNGYSKVYYFVPDPQQRECYGKLIGHFNFKDGEKHGTQLDYRCNNGELTIAKKSEFDDGQVLSEISYYHNDVKEYEHRFNGLNKEWNYEGQLIAEYNLKDGVESGLKVLYHPNGQIKMKGQMLDGNHSGEWVAYHQDGLLFSKFTKDPNVYYFVNLEKYSSKGVLVETTTFENGLHFVTQYDSITKVKTLEEYRKYTSETKFTIANERRYFYDDSSIKSEFRYTSTGYYSSIEVYGSDSTKIGGGVFGNEGFPIGTWVIFRNEEGQFNWDPELSNRYYEANFENGEPGQFKGYNKDGVLIGKGSFIPLQGFQFEETGTWEYYYADGAVKGTGSFERGRKHGRWELFNEDGSLKAVQQYYFGELRSEQSATEIRAEEFNTLKSGLINRYRNYSTQNSNPIVQYYQYRARGTDRYIIFEKGLILINHHFSSLQGCSNIDCVQTIKNKLEAIEQALKKYQTQNPGSLTVKLKLAKKPEKIEQLLLR